MAKFSRTYGSGIIAVPVPDRAVNWAVDTRKARDLLYKDRYALRETDRKWVGELGERAFDSWLHHKGIWNAHWHLDNPVGNTDFTLPGNIPVGIKTSNRKRAPHGAQSSYVGADHIDEPSDWFFFMIYQELEQIMWLMGAITRHDFKQLAQFHPAGTRVHSGLVTFSDAYNIDHRYLTRPDAWLDSLLKMRNL